MRLHLSMNTSCSPDYVGQSLVVGPYQIKGEEDCSGTTVHQFKQCCLGSLVSINSYDLPMGNDESGLVVYAARCSQSQSNCAAHMADYRGSRRAQSLRSALKKKANVLLQNPRWQDTGWWPQQIVDIGFSVSSRRIRHSRTRSGLAWHRDRAEQGYSVRTYSVNCACFLSCTPTTEDRLCSTQSSIFISRPTVSCR